MSTLTGFIVDRIINIRKGHSKKELRGLGLHTQTANAGEINTEETNADETDAEETTLTRLSTPARGRHNHRLNTVMEQALLPSYFNHMSQNDCDKVCEVQYVGHAANLDTTG